MFDSSQNLLFVPERQVADRVATNPESLKAMCLDSASLWLLRRRANLRYRAPQRLPEVARVS